jgi:predicted ester cyclase
MDHDAMIEAVRAAVAALNAGDLATYGAAFDPAARRWTLGFEGTATPAEVGAQLADLLRAFDGFHLDEELILSDANRVVARWRTSGTHVADYYGIPATGRTFAVQTCEIYEFDGDRVAATWSYGDPMDLVKQLTT